MKRYRSDDEIEPYYRNLVVRNIPNTIPDPDVVDCLYQEYRKYGKCKVSEHISYENYFISFFHYVVSLLQYLKIIFK